MRSRWVLFSIVLGVLAADATASADPPKKHNLKDPENKRGISPFMEAIVKGQKAYIARDFPGATAAFQEAIKADTEKLLGFLRLGEAQLAEGHLDEANAAWKTALEKKGTSDDKAKVLFQIADLRERQHKWQEAKDAWTAYAQFLQNTPNAKGFPATSIERIKQIDQRMKLEVDYGAVKDRIAKREKEREQEAIENAKKDKLNR